MTWGNALKNAVFKFCVGVYNTKKQVSKILPNGGPWGTCSKRWRRRTQN